MEAERLIMRKKEQDRSEIIRLYIEGYTKQKEAAKRWGPARARFGMWRIRKGKRCQVLT